MIFPKKMEGAKNTVEDSSGEMVAAPADFSISHVDSGETVAAEEEDWLEGLLLENFRLN